MGKAVSKRAELENLFRRYPDVPREVIIKEDLLRLGQAFTEAALEVGESHRTKMYGGWLFTFDRATPQQMKHREVFRVPDYLELKGGLYGLRGRLRVRCRLNPESPYIIDVIDGKLMVCEADGESNAPIAELYEFRPIPSYYTKQFEDGTPYREVSRYDGFVVAFTMCQHWGPKEECKFCDINENTRAARKRGALTQKKPVKKVEQVAEVIGEIFLEEEWAPYDRPLGVLISGGAITRTLEGMSEVDFYGRYVVAVREKIGYRWPLCLQSAPKPKQEAKRWRDMGVDIHHVNMEVWDKRLFEIICPGKARVVGWDNWLKWTLEEVDVFGEDKVCPGFVVGVEMAQPWGFKEVDEAVESTTKGFEYLMSHGVVPRPITWCVEPLSPLGGHEPPPLDYLIKVDREWYELLVKYRLPAPGDALHVRRTGPGRNEYPNNAAADMEG